MKPFAIYIAASSHPSQAQRVRAAIAMLRSHGFIITSTWLSNIEKVGDANPRGVRAGDRRSWAVQCLDEIDGADALWFLVPELPATTRGGWGELLYAYANHKHVVSSGDVEQSIFPALGYEFGSDDAALRHLRQLRDRDVALAELADAPAMDMRLRNALVGGGETR